MITLIAGDPSDPALPILLSAFSRSVTRGLVTIGHDTLPGGVTAFLSPREDQAPLLAEAVAGAGKALVFGRVGPEIATLCGLADPRALAEGWLEAATCRPAPVHGTSQSAAEICWHQQGLGAASPLAIRPFLRFDFSNEWNNLGYGRITADGSPWSISIDTTATSATVLATARAADLDPVPMVTLLDTADGAVLWWNRAVGPADSAEWAVVETFLADWRNGSLACVPVVEEIPWGADCAITMRLDCDEDIASARPLFDLYRQRNIPFSAAVKTDQPAGADALALLAAIKASGGAILSHSVTHAANWGGSEENCVAEARGSSDWLEARVAGLKVRYAVSPFHQNPDFVPAALAKAGLTGFVGGIVANDPQMLLARGGQPPDDAGGVVTHSQQCMLHGDCMVVGDDPLAVPKAAFRSARKSRTLFGYLDHPFSARYDYGWGSEKNRLAAHAALLDFIEAETVGARVVRWSEDQALDWIAAKDRLRLEPNGSSYKICGRSDRMNEFSLRWRGARVPPRALPVLDPGRRHILVVVGTRPEAIKLAPLVLALRRRPQTVKLTLLSTGQHREMLAQALNSFGLVADIDIEAMQPDQTLGGLTAALVSGCQATFAAHRPDIVVVQGDTTSAFAAALAAFYERVPVAHVEAGLRSSDIDNPFPEEANRKLITTLASLHFAPTVGAARALRHEGVSPKAIHITGNTIVDALALLRSPKATTVSGEIETMVKSSGDRLVLVTCHRRESFGADLDAIIRALQRLAVMFPDRRFFFPVHFNPRVRSQVMPRLSGIANLTLADPVSYADLLHVLAHAELAITDSGGIQEEAPSFGLPTIVLRRVTERPEGVRAGFARLSGPDEDAIVAVASRWLRGNRRKALSGRPNPFGDGQAAERIAGVLEGWQP